MNFFLGMLTSSSSWCGMVTGSMLLIWLRCGQQCTRMMMYPMSSTKNERAARPNTRLRWNRQRYRDFTEFSCISLYSTGSCPSYFVLVFVCGISQSLIIKKNIGRLQEQLSTWSKPIECNVRLVLVCSDGALKVASGKATGVLARINSLRFILDQQFPFNLFVGVSFVSS